MPLKLQQTQTRDGVYTVTYAFERGSADAQDMAFGAQGLHTISPAELGMLREGVDNSSPFTSYSRTNMDVVIDDRDGRVVLAKGGVITTPFLSDLVDVHRNCREFVIPEQMKDSVYGAIDTMLCGGTALATARRNYEIPTNRFGEEEITAFMYGDESLGIAADKYGAWLAEQGKDEHSISFSTKRYAEQQSGPYATRLRLCSSTYDFGAGSGCWDLSLFLDAFGVSIELSDRLKSLLNNFLSSR